MLFDVLRLDGRDVTALPWSERRALLDRLGLSGGTWQTPAIVRGDADTALATARRLGLEGIVAKRIDAPYRPGKRTTAWQKVKLSKRQELVIGGWLPVERRLSGTVGSLLVGYHEVPGGPFRYAGRVGSGLDDAGRDALKEQLEPRSTSPFVEMPPRLPDPRWVEPDVVVEVKFTVWTSEGVLREPVFVGIRTDKDPADVVRE
jgi:bifunctional non-homologous end joining protein LigD